MDDVLGLFGWVASNLNEFILAIAASVVAAGLLAVMKATWGWMRWVRFVRLPARIRRISRRNIRKYVKYPSSRRAMEKMETDWFRYLMLLVGMLVANLTVVSEPSVLNEIATSFLSVIFIFGILLFYYLNSINRTASDLEEKIEKHN